MVLSNFTHRNTMEMSYESGSGSILEIQLIVRLDLSRNIEEVHFFVVMFRLLVVRVSRKSAHHHQYFANITKMVQGSADQIVVILTCSCTKHEEKKSDEAHEVHDSLNWVQIFTLKNE